MSTLVSIRRVLGAVTIAGTVCLTSLAGGAASADEPWFAPANTKYSPVKLQRTAAPATNQITAGILSTSVTGGRPFVICDKMGCREFPGPQ